MFRRHRWTDPLLDLACFADASPQEQATLLRQVDTLFAATGMSLLKTAGHARELVLVITGELVSSAPQPRAYGPGAIIGARAFLDGRPQPHEVCASRPSRLGFLSVEQARVLIKDSPTFGILLASAVARDLTDATTDQPHANVGTPSPPDPPKPPPSPSGPTGPTESTGPQPLQVALRS